MAEAAEATGGEQGDLLKAAEAAPEAGVQSPESSTGTETPAVAATDASAESSPAEGVKQPSPLDAVMKALGRDPGTEASPAQESEAQDKDATKPEGEAAATTATESEGADAKLPFAAHPRFKQLLTQRNEFKAKAEQYDARLKELEPKAQHFEQLTKYAAAANFTSKDFQDLLHMGRLMKNDPIAFHEAFRGQWAEIEKMVGARLPDDLQRKVDDGLIDEETAQELARKRGEASLNGERAERITRQTAEQTEQAERQAQERQHAELVAKVQTSVTNWEAQWKGSDPDYAKKQPRVTREIKLALYENPPTSVEEALAICNAARKAVDEEIRSYLPARPSIRPNGSGTSVDTKGVAKTPLDAAMMALENMAAR